MVHFGGGYNDFRVATLREALVFLKAWSHWFYVVKKDPKYYPALSLFWRELKSAEDHLRVQSRKTVLRLANLRRCIFCGAEVSLGSGDHIIPVSRGGPNSAENFMPLCKRCNSSKGNKDLLEWWFSKGRKLRELNLDVLVIYLRFQYRIAEKEVKLDEPPSPNIFKAVREAMIELPEQLRKKITLFAPLAF